MIGAFSGAAQIALVKRRVSSSFFAAARIRRYIRTPSSVLWRGSSLPSDQKNTHG